MRLNLDSIKSFNVVIGDLAINTRIDSLEHFTMDLNGAGPSGIDMRIIRSQKRLSSPIICLVKRAVLRSSMVTKTGR